MTADAVGDHFDHPAFLYEDRDDFLGFMVPYVSAGLERDEIVFVAAKGEYLGPLSDEIDGDPRVTLEDTDRWYPHPASRLRALFELLTGKLSAGATRFRLAGEPVWKHELPEYTYEWQRYESALNAVLAPFPASMVCLYDAKRLDPSIIETARRTHPTVRERGSDGPSASYEPPDGFLRRWNLDLDTMPATAVAFAEASDLPGARRFLRRRAVAAGVPPDAAADLCIAANEVLTNAVLHGGGPLRLRVWTDGGRFVCQISDGGPGIADALAGYHPPRSNGIGGRGLWVARQLVDLMQIVPGSPGTIVRLHAKIG